MMAGCGYDGPESHTSIPEGLKAGSRLCALTVEPLLRKREATFCLDGKRRLFAVGGVSSLPEGSRKSAEIGGIRREIGGSRF